MSKSRIKDEGGIETVGETLNLERQLRRDIQIEIENMDLKQFRKRFPKLASRVIDSLIDLKGSKDERVAGFLLEPEDPFAEGTERQFQKLGGIGQRVIVRKIEQSKLPMIMPYDDPATKLALESYIVRADGGDDQKRADMARAAIKKCK